MTSGRQSSMKFLPAYLAGSRHNELRAQGAWPPRVAECVPWLDAVGIAWDAHTHEATPSREAYDLLSQVEAAGPPRPRHLARRTKRELVDLQEEYRARPGAGHGAPLEDVWAEMWDERRSGRSKIAAAPLARRPADHLGCYRVFHAVPHEHWGIYISADRLVSYCDDLYRSLQGRVHAFTRETLAACVLFEVFHHQFYHHLVECTATVMEIIAGTLGEPQPLYLRYLQGAYEEALGRHPHQPLEEALANAYAYRAFSFSGQMKSGYKGLLATLYKRLLEASWPQEAEGYCEAQRYVGGTCTGGTADLLGMLLGSSEADPGLLLLLAHRVMPAGHMGFAQKPEIPLYLLGEPEALQRLEALVPAPSEAGVALYWPGDTSAVDRYFRERRKEERAGGGGS